jgi:hypothetical protein
MLLNFCLFCVKKFDAERERDTQFQTEYFETVLQLSVENKHRKIIDTSDTVAMSRSNYGQSCTTNRFESLKSWGLNNVSNQWKYYFTSVYVNVKCECRYWWRDWNNRSPRKPQHRTIKRMDFAMKVNLEKARCNICQIGTYVHQLVEYLHVWRGIPDEIAQRNFLIFKMHTIKSHMKQHLCYLTYVALVMAQMSELAVFYQNVLDSSFSHR